MQIAVFSDTHGEFQKWNPPTLDPHEVDVIVVAGDLGASVGHYASTLADLRHKNPDIGIVTVLGNHEFYKGPPLNNRESFEYAAYEYGAVLLDNSMHMSTGNDGTSVLFVGGTLWTDAHASPNAREGPRMMNDYRRIGWLHNDEKVRDLTTQNVSLENHITRDMIFSTLVNYTGLPVVVVTHHAPSLRSAESLRGHYNDLNDFYCNDFDEAIKTLGGPAAWIHGHIHNSSDYMIGTTRVVCNPRGYGPSHFNPDFVADGVRIII